MMNMPLGTPNFHNFCMRAVSEGESCLGLPVHLLQSPGGMLAQAANLPGTQGSPPRPGQGEAPGPGTAGSCMSQSSTRGAGSPAGPKYLSIAPGGGRDAPLCSLWSNWK